MQPYAATFEGFAYSAPPLLQFSYLDQVFSGYNRHRRAVPTHVDERGENRRIRPED